MAEMLDQLQDALSGRYRIERELGRGGTATVFLAEDLRHRRRVALKVLDPELAAVLGPARFLREIETVARLTHPHILPLFDSGAAHGLLFYAMPYVEGESLRARLVREKQLPVEDALRIVREVADALSYAHDQGIVHRDIKPGNILLEEGHAVVADFGIARAAVPGAETLTATGIAVGTPAYMSPEQAAGSRAMDGRSDLYSLGCVLYEMLAGVPPFVGATAESLAHQHLNVAPRPVTELRPAVPDAIAAALQRALAKAPADRFATAAGFAAALAPAAVTPIAAPPGGAVPAAASGDGRPHGGRSRRLALAGGIGLLAVLAAGVVWTPVMQRLGGRSSAPSPRKEWILVAEFDGPADDTTLATAARSLVSAALDESKLLATVPPDQIQLALQEAGKPTSTRLSPQVARELAYRRAVRAVLEGEIQRLGRGYSLVLRVVDAESLRVVVTRRATARDEDGLIPTLGRLAADLRRELGERRSLIASTRPLIAATTSSFEAYELWVRARGLVERNQTASLRAGVALLREALRLDPGFFRAWALLGSAYYNLEQRDSSRAAFQEALRHAERATSSATLGVRARLARADGDLEGSLAAFDALLADDPSAWAAWNSRAVTLEGLGRFEEALESTRRAAALAPIGATPITRYNEIFFLCELGRVEEARRLARSLPGLLGLRGLIMAATVAAEWATVESLAVSAEREPGFTAGMVSAQVISARAGRGSYREAADMCARGGAPGTENAIRRAHVLLGVMSAGAIPLPADAWSADTTTASLLTRGLRAAAAGDRGVARNMLAMVRARPRLDQLQQGATPVLLDAWIRALEGRWSEVPPLLVPAALRPGENDAAHPMGVTALRWTLADAYERAGAPDSAAVWLERIATDPGAVDRDAAYRGIAQSAAHHRLVLLFARMGRLADAERHLTVIERWWDRPDDIARRMLAEARAAVRAARGVARPEKVPT